MTTSKDIFSRKQCFGGNETPEWMEHLGYFERVDQKKVDLPILVSLRLELRGMTEKKDVFVAKLSHILKKFEEGLLHLEKKKMYIVSLSNLLVFTRVFLISKGLLVFC